MRFWPFGCSVYPARFVEGLYTVGTSLPDAGFTVRVYILYPTPHSRRPRQSEVARVALASRATGQRVRESRPTSKRRSCVRAGDAGYGTSAQKTTKLNTRHGHTHWTLGIGLRPGRQDSSGRRSLGALLLSGLTEGAHEVLPLSRERALPLLGLVLAVLPIDSIVGERWA